MEIGIGLGTSSGSANYKYKYNGKELQDELGLNMYAMDMRQYDPAIARWVVQDPVVHHNMSPYNAFDNNPVYWADPSGADADSSVDIWGRNRYNEMGMFIPPHERGNASNTDCIGNECKPNTADKTASGLLIIAAFKILTDANKNDNNDSNIEVANLLLDFANGSGAAVRNYDYNKGDKFAKNLLDNSKISELISVINNRLKKEGYDFSGKDTGLYENVKLTFSPDTAGFLNAYDKHKKANLVQLFIGGSVVDFKIKNGYLMGTIKNETSRNSLFFHLGENYERDSNGKGAILSTIKQNIHFKFKLYEK